MSKNIFNINRVVRASFLRLRKVYAWHKRCKNLFWLGRPLIRVGYLIKAKYSKSYISAIMVFLSRLQLLKRKSGLRYTCLYLKACSLYIIKVVTRDPNELNCMTYGLKVSRTRGGIPRILPERFRVAIKRKEYDSIRHILTICGLYRVLPFDAKLSTDTITDPDTSVLPEEFKVWLRGFYRSHIKLEIKRPFEPRLICSRGPGELQGHEEDNTTGYVVEALKALAARRLLSPALKLMSAFPQTNASYAWITLFEKIVKDNLKELRYQTGIPHHALARLSIKVEPGKVRLFAIVDIITQWVLRPIHLGLFEVLRRWTTDATFDQDLGLNRFFSRVSKGDTIYSFDLSAATDRLPLSLQKLILEQFRRGFGEAWAKLIVDRPFVLKWKPRKMDDFFRYMTGQPMGAYSSWAMLAVSHHVIIQYSAYKARGVLTWFDKYCVLGDDMIIADTNVAQYYYYFMTKVLKVKINLSKSLVSRDGWGEFAKRIRTKDCHLTPLSLKEFSSWGKVSGAFMETLKLFPNITVYRILTLLGKGSRSAGNINVLAKVFAEAKIYLDPNLSVKEKFLATVEKDTLPEKEEAFKYLLWSKVWDTWLELKDYNRSINSNLPNYRKTVDKAILYFWNWPDPWLRIIKSSLESSHLMKSVLFGASTERLDQLYDDLLIRNKSYSEVTIDDLIFIWDVDFDSIIKDPALVTGSLDHLKKIEGKTMFRADYDALNKYMKFGKYSRQYFKKSS